MCFEILEMKMSKRKMIVVDSQRAKGKGQSGEKFRQRSKVSMVTEEVRCFD